VETVEKAGPAVVNISAEQRITNPFASDPLGQFFRDFFEGGRSEERVQNSLGSGVLIDPAGYILTNEHVISAASRVRVTLHDKREFWAEIVGTSQESDLAVLKISEKEPLPAIALGSSDDLLIGETAIAIGNPFGLSNTVTVGVVRRFTDRDAAGTALQRLRPDRRRDQPRQLGRRAAQHQRRAHRDQRSDHRAGPGIGFAIPIDRAKSIYHELVQYGEVRPVYSRARHAAARSSQRRRDGRHAAARPHGHGGARSCRRRGGPAAGDVIVKADQAPVESPRTSRPPWGARTSATRSSSWSSVKGARRRK
jgi:S1-C subfamily serine protease